MAGTVTDKVSAVSNLIRLRNQSGTLLLMMPSLWSLVLAADGHPSLTLLAIFIVGSFVMRSAGCAFNDLVDQDIDCDVARTRERPLPSGQLERIEAVFVFIILLGAAAFLLTFLNQRTVFLSLGAVGLVMLYPFAKRMIAMPQAVLGVAFGWGAIMAWVAVREVVEAPPLLIFLATVFWAIGYDTIYATQDKEDDRRIGVGSTALLFGRFAWVAIGMCFLGMMTCLIAVGMLANIGTWFFVCLGVVSLIMAVQIEQIRRGLTRHDALDMFRSHAWIGVAILIGFVIGLT